MQIEQENLEINYVRCTRPELTELIKDVLKPFHMVIKERNLVTQVNLQTSVPVSFLIEKKVYSEILYNLFQNAVKYNKFNGTLKTMVSYEKGTGKLWTVIEDTGVGMDIKKKHDLFIAFRGTSKKVKSETLAKAGVGIGLSNSKCLINSLNGTIDLQSKPDKGTIVTFSIDVTAKPERTENEIKATVSNAIDKGLLHNRSENDSSQDERLEVSDFEDKPGEETKHEDNKHEIEDSARKLLDHKEEESSAQPMVSSRD